MVDDQESRLKSSDQGKISKIKILDPGCKCIKWQ